MTEKLFDFDSYLQEFDANVIDCIPDEKKKLYDIILDRTVFFPEEGGQTSDTGFLTAISSDNNVINAFVGHVSIKDGIIHHFSETAVPKGTAVHGKINFEERFSKMQQHSGEHLISGFVHSRFGYDNTGFHLGSTEVTLDFNGTFTADEILLIENEVNKAILANVKCNISVPDADELAKIPYRSKKELEGPIRIVEFPGYDICACCAPHVAYTSEIGICKIISAEHFRGGTRMSILCGTRALYDYRKKHDMTKSISVMLSAGQEDIVSATKKLKNDYDNACYNLIALENRLFEYLIPEALLSVNPTIFTASAETLTARNAVNKMCEKSSGICSVFVGNDNDGYRFIAGSSSFNCIELLNKLKASHNAKGGGSPKMIQGTVIAAADIISEVINQNG